VEQERIIRESELNTEIAVENKNREIQRWHGERFPRFQFRRRGGDWLGGQTGTYRDVGTIA
jgi:hypothetical protein